MQDIKYTKLGDDFFRGMRNPLTPTKLAQLAELAEKIPLSEQLGTFINEEHYLQTYNLLFQSTIGPRMLGYLFLKEILPKIKTKNNLLEVGVGSGVFLKWYGKKFSEITVIDNSKTILENLNFKNKILPSKTNLNKRCEIIENASLPENYFDFCVLSHVLYYVKRDQWSELISNIYNSLKQDGVIVIIFGDGYEGKAKLLWDFGEKTFDFNGFARACLSKYKGNMTMYNVAEDFHAKSLRHMLHIAGFLMLDINVTTSREILEEYIKINYERNGYFLVTSQLKILLIKKSRNF